MKFHLCRCARGYTIEVDELPGPVASDDLDRMAYALDHRRQHAPTSVLWG